MSDQLGLQPFLESLTWFIKKSKQLNLSDIASDIAALGPVQMVPNEALVPQGTMFCSYPRLPYTDLF